MLMPDFFLTALSCRHGLEVRALNNMCTVTVLRAIVFDTLWKNDKYLYIYIFTYIYVYIVTNIISAMNLGNLFFFIPSSFSAEDV